MLPKIDTHQHLLYPKRFEYPWAAGIPALQGDFRLEEYRLASGNCGIEGTLFMEVDALQGGDEARFFCELAEDPTNGILGVLAACRPESADFEATLDALNHPKLKGLRRVLHTQPDELSESPLFRENISRLAARNLTFDLCVLQRQLGIALDLVRACPETVFILDHCGVPDIAGNAPPDGAGFLQWQEDVHLLARESNVHCKLSGITAYAGRQQQNPESLAPYFETLCESFGLDRLVWGGDWPVVNLGAGLNSWCEISEALISGLSPSEQDAILRSNAIRIYNLGSTRKL